MVAVRVLQVVCILVFVILAHKEKIMLSKLYKIIRKIRVIKVAFLIIFVLLLFVVCDTLYVCLHRSSEYKKTLVNLKTCVKRFLVLNNGVFPESERELIEKGVLVKRKSLPFDDYHYLLPRSLPTELVCFDQNEISGENIKSYINLYRFEAFVIFYGVGPDKIDASSSRLFHKPTGEHILLISGPRRLPFLRKKQYEKVSFELYQEMVRLQKEAGNIDGKDESEP